LGAVLLIAFTLRLWGAFFGLPNVYHPDEGFEVYRALRLGMGGFDFDRVAKGGYYFLLFLEYGTYFVVQRLMGAVSSATDFAIAFIRDPSPFWKIGRVTTAILGTLTVGLVWHQGRRIQGALLGLLAAGLLTVSCQHVIDSHTITVDVPMTLFTFISIFLVTEDVAGRRRLPSILFAFAAAYAIMNKIPAILLFVPYFLGAWMRGGFRGPRGVLTRSTLLPVVLTALIYAIANPGSVVNFADTVDLASHTVGGHTEKSEEYGDIPLRTNLWGYYGNVLVRSQGPALLSLAAIGAVLALFRRQKELLLHLSFVVCFFVVLAESSSSHLYYPRYVVPILPGICLAAAYALDELTQRLQASPKSAYRWAAALAVLICIEPLMASVKWDLRLMREDTRTKAVEWVEHNVPEGARILLEGFPEETAQLSIPLENSEQNIKAMIETLQTRDAGKAEFWEMKLAHPVPPAYDLVTIRHFEDWWTLEETRRQGIEWIVLRREYFVPGTIPTRKFGKNTVISRSAFYRDLTAAQDSRKMAEFDADPDGAPGYDFEIWKIGAGTSQAHASGGATSRAS
jgi:hypothetical protein